MEISTNHCTMTKSNLNDSIHSSDINSIKNALKAHDSQQLEMYLNYDPSLIKSVMKYLIRHDMFNIITELLNNNSISGNYESLNECMMYAAKNKKFSIVSYFVSMHLDIHINDSYILMKACEHGQQSLIIQLINMNADITIYENKPLRCAIRSKHIITDTKINTIKCLIEHNASVKIGLIYACKICDIDIVKLMLANGASVSYESLIASVSYGNVELVKLLFENGGNINDKIFIQTCVYGDLSMVQYMIKELKLNIPINALLISLQACRTSIAQYLIEEGADPHIKNEYPLKFFCRVNNLHMVKKLLNMSANINVNNGICLTLCNTFEMMEYLVSNGINIDRYGNRALYNAIVKDDISIVKYLITLGINVSHKMINISLSYGSAELIKIISDNAK